MAAGTSIATALLLAGLAAGAVPTPSPGPRYAGAATTVAVNRLDGRIAVLRDGRLEVYADAAAQVPAAAVGIPGKSPEVVEFRGNTVLYATHEVRGLATAWVAVSAEGRERLAWPNEGLSELFPTERSRLTLDGKGVFGTLPLDAEARAYFELPATVPDGSGVVATYRFAGERLMARGAPTFAGAVGLTPDDLLVALRGGGALRYRSPGGVAWSHDAGPRGGARDWLIADPQAGGLALFLDGEGALVALDLDGGQERFRWPPGGHAEEIAAWLQREGGPTSRGPAAAPRLLDARRLRSGDVLVLGESERKWLGVVEVAGGRLREGEVLGRLRRAGLDTLATAWALHAADLSGTFELPAESGSSLLMRGADGWYEVRLR